MLPPSTALVLESIDWGAIVDLVYSVTGARLILNVCEAGCSFGESLLSKPIHSMQFHHWTDHDDDDEELDTLEEDT
ncbi:hypothetical protein D9756_008307 [Leucocoprinus leucothites]|uniref:Uncharacterized protein n=1 Tax=Leucocoprinus leucothites TaxID=201217 RepID=A0A8H5FVF3_9AGAR|nr:hypothetical protein D9756_008307 [Leucoagaricus leucothites]